MSGDRFFVDTNVLVYAHDVTAGDKRNRARSLVGELWETRQGSLSVQVLQEFFVTTTRKIPKPLEAPAAAQIIGDLAHWHVHAPTASRRPCRHRHPPANRASFWDAMILRSAQELGCQILYSEELNAGQDYAGVEVRNPFLT